MSALLELPIGGRTYRVAVGHGEETRLKALAQRVDAMLNELKLADANIDRDRQLVLTCLQLVANLSDAQDKLDNQASAVTQFHRQLADRLENLLPPVA